MNESLIIAAVKNEAEFQAALASDVKLIFHLVPNIMTLQDNIKQAHSSGKSLFIHLDLAEGIGRDRAGLLYLAQAGADGIISTRAQMIQIAKELGLVTVQRFFLLDSKGIESIDEMLKHTSPHLIELMPGVICKSIRRFGNGSIPVIAGGLIETKAEVLDALGCGATAVSTGRKDLWYL